MGSKVSIIPTRARVAPHSGRLKRALTPADVPDETTKMKIAIRNIHTVFVGDGSDAPKNRTTHEVVRIAPKAVNYIYVSYQLSGTDQCSGGSIP